MRGVDRSSNDYVLHIDVNVGPSGSGKTTLLNYLAGELSSSKIVEDPLNTILFPGSICIYMYAMSLSTAALDNNSY